MIIKIIGCENELELKKGYINIIEIHNLAMFRNVVAQLCDVSQGLRSNSDIKIIKDGNEIQYKNDIYFVDNIININFKSRKFINALYKELLLSVDNVEMDLAYNDVINILEKFIIEMIYNLDVNIEIDQSIKFEALLKAFNIRIEESESINILNNIYRLIDALAELKICNNIVFINLKSLISNKELEELNKYALYKNITIIILESNKSKEIKVYENILVVTAEFEDYII